MKLVTYTYEDDQRLGALLDSVVVDLQACYAAYRLDVGEMDQAPAALPSDMLSYLQAGPTAWQTARTIMDWVQNDDELRTSQPDFLLPSAELRLGPPIPNPGKVIGIGLNYADHAREQNLEPPPAPIVFAKFSTSVIGPEEAITWPPGASSQVDYEAELAVVMGRRAYQVDAAQAYDFIAGYTIANDVSARDAQFSDEQWVRGKSFDTFCPLGPYLLTTDELPDPHQLAIRCQVNGTVLQDSRTDQLIFSVPVLIEYISRTCTLLPGDVICTGTPHGVGVFRDPQVFLQPGDVVEVEIEKLGVLRNPVR